MTTYYVDPVNGVDSNNGTTTSTPWQSLRYAQSVAILAAGDEIILQGGALTPNRIQNFIPTSDINDSVSMDAAISIASASRSAITSSTDISDGVVRGNILKNQTFDQWTAGANTQLDWTRDPAGGTAQTKETTNTYSGGATAIKIDATGGFDGITQHIWLPAGLTLKMSVAMRVDTATERYIARLWDRTGNDFFDWQNGGFAAAGNDVYMQVGDGFFGASDSTYYLCESGSVTFPEHVLTVTTGRHTFKLSNATGNGVYYVDDAALTPNGDFLNYDWADDTTTDVYVLDKPHFIPWRVLVCTEAEWTARGVRAFSGYANGYQKYNLIANCRANESSFHFDSTNNKLYVHLPAGTDISTLHIEAYPKGALLNVEEDVVISNVDVCGAAGVVNVSGATITQSECHNVNAYSCVAGFVSNAGKMKVMQCNSYFTRVGFTVDGGGTQDTTTGSFLATGASTEIDAEGCEVIGEADDGFQASVGGIMRCTGCLSRDSQTAAQSKGAANEGHGYKISTDANTKGIFKGCTALNINNGAGFNLPTGVSASGTEFSLDSCAADGSSANDLAIRTGPATLTVSNTIVNSYTETGTTAFSLGTNNKSVQDADITDVGIGADGAPDSDSPLVGAGTKWWTGPNPTGANGEPFSDMQTDAGSIQTTYYKLHPANQ